MRHWQLLVVWTAAPRCLLTLYIAALPARGSGWHVADPVTFSSPSFLFFSGPTSRSQCIWLPSSCFEWSSAIAGVKGRRIRELTSVVQKRFKFPEGSVELYAEKVANRGLCSIAQAESLRYKLLGGLAVRRCASSTPTLALMRLCFTSLPLPTSAKGTALVLGALAAFTSMHGMQRWPTAVASRSACRLL